MITDHNKTAIWTASREISYNETLRRIGQFATLCQVPKHSKVVIFSENRPGFIYALFAIWQNGSTAVPVDSTSSAADLAYVINDCQPVAIWATEKTEATAREAISRAGGNQSVLLITPDTEDGACDAQPARIEYQLQDTALIIYTSGTTGSPKGVMLSFENINFNVNAVSPPNGVPIFTPDVRTMILLPCHHVLPLLGSIVAPLASGGSVAFCPGMSAPELMDTLANGKVGIIIGVPRLYSMLSKGIRSKIDAHFFTRALYKLCEKIGSRTLSRLVFSSIRKMMGGAIKYFVSGGAALDPSVARIMKTLGLDVLEGYGMTECAPMIAFTRPDDITPGASGQPVPGCEVEVRDGELCARGKNIMQGYYNRPEETAAVVRDGWIYTGDLGYIDDKGRVVVTGRRKEIIVLSNGKNVNPVDIEQHLESYAAIVKEAAVTEKDDALVAIIVPQPSLASLTDQQIEERVKWDVIEKYNADAAAYKKIFNVRIHRGDLPRTKLDKLQRFKLKSLLVDEQTHSPEVVDDAQSDEYKIIKKYIESEKVCKVRPTDHIELDLAFDSLDKVGLQVFINNSFGLNISTDELSQFRSVAAMADFVAESKTKIQVEKIDWKKILREHTTLKLPQTWLTGRLFIALSQPFFRLYFKLTGKGAERIPDGPVIIAPNHQSFLDGLFVMSFLKFRDIKNTYFYAKEQHVRQPFVKFMAATHNVIVMDMSNLKDSIQKMGEALKKKKNIIIFPEGTRTTDGKLGEFKKTFAILSKELNVPVVPVSIKGAFQAMPKGRKIPMPHKVQVEFLNPIYPGQSTYEGLTRQVYNSIKRNQELSN